MKLRQVISKISRFSVLPLILLLPLVAFADNGKGNCGIPGNGGCKDDPSDAPEINMTLIDSAMTVLIGGAMWLRHRSQQARKK